jgi:hypothetical protein
VQGGTNALKLAMPVFGDVVSIPHNHLSTARAAVCGGIGAYSGIGTADSVCSGIGSPNNGCEFCGEF